MAQNWSRVQASTTWASGSASGTTKSFGSNVTAGNAIIVAFNHSYQGCPPSVADNQGNTYTQVVSAVGANPASLYVWIAIASSTGALTVTPTFGCGTITLGAIVEYTNIPSGSFDVVSTRTTNTSGPTVNGGSVTTSAADDLVMSMFFSGVTVTFTASSGSQIFGGVATSVFMQDENNPTAGAVNPSAVAAGTVSASYPVTAWIWAFKQTAGGAITFIPIPQLLSMMVG